MIDKATVAQILDAADIVEVVSDFVSLKRRGANYVGLCPLSASQELKEYATASVAAKAVAPLILSWNMNNFPIMKP